MSVQSSSVDQVQSGRVQPSTLWARVQSGDRAAFCEILGEHYNAARAGANRYAISAQSGVSFDNEDAAQIAAMYAVECFDAGAFDNMTEAEFRRWLFLQGKDKSRQLIIYSRRAKRDSRRTATIGETAIASSVKATVERQSELSESVSQLFSQFSEYEDVLRGLMDGMSVPEIAKATGLTRLQVRFRLRKVSRLAKASESR